MTDELKNKGFMALEIGNREGRSRDPGQEPAGGMITC